VRSPSPPPPARSSRWRLPGWLLALVLFGIAGAGAGALVVLLSRPQIDTIDPALTEPGSVITIHGSNFGATRGESSVEVDGVDPIAASYLEWSKERISLRLPGTVDSGLVFVIVEGRRSNPKLFMNKARLPVEPTAVTTGGTGPWLSSLSADRGPVGTLIILSGSGFGTKTEDRAVRFAWNPEDPPGAPGERSSPQTLRNSDVDLGNELWTDKEIRVRVPDGAVSGAIFVVTPQGVSNGLFFDVAGLPGTKRFYDRRSYSISYSVGISKIQASGSNELYLWVPRPVESSSQVIVKKLAEEPRPFDADYRGLALYRFRDLAAGQNHSVNLSWLVQTYAVETKIEPDWIKTSENPGPIDLAYTAADSLVPSGAPEVIALAAKITGSEKNPWREAKLIYDWLVHSLTWREVRDTRTPVAALGIHSADSWNYSIIATALLRASGVPAIPVAGLLVDPSRRTARHTWVEFYIDGFGWVPMDPILGSGARPGGFAPAFEDLPRYFGNLDDRRIAFSRGWAELDPMAANGRRATPARPLAYQSYYEEAAGALEAYSSFWSEVEVTGLY
jgi:transglutaminase-like putative cysteine protease